jgi:N-acetylmuramoyl-L-alanine amidase
MGQEGTAASGGITRRTLVAGAAAAGAASLIAPATGFASAARKRPSSVSVGDLLGVSKPIVAPARFALAGVEWSAPVDARIELRTQTAAGGRWSSWAVASVLGHDGDGSRRVQLFGEPIWTGPAVRVQLRSDVSVRGLRVHLVAAPSEPVLDAGLAVAPPLAQPIFDAGPGQPPIIARSAWAAGRARPVHPPGYGTVELAFVHHTVSPNGYGAAQVPAMLRAIFDYHVYVRGFWDIAYNFVIDAFGRIWEARAGGIDMAVIGAQAGGYNTESTGVAVLGTFMDVVPSHLAMGALKRLLAWKLSLHGLPSYGRVTVVVDPAEAYYTPFRPGAHVGLPRIAGHRDGDSTDCPGDAFYHRLPAIRPHVAALAGTPAVASLIASPAVITAGSTVTVSGALELLTGGPLAGAPIELQQLGPQGPPASTIAALTTAADGTWSSSLSSETNLVLRAVHPAYPAAVTDWTLVGVAPALTLELQSASPLVVTGTISPATRRVTLALYPSTRATGKPLKRRRVGASQGQFSAELPTPGPGNYIVIARSDADASNAAAASAPLSVTVP